MLLTWVCGMQLGDLGIAKLAKTEGMAAKTQIGEAIKLKNLDDRD